MKKKISTLLAVLFITLSTSIALGQSAVSWFTLEGTIAGAKVNGAMTLFEGGRVEGNYGYNKNTRSNPNAYLQLYGTWRRTGSNTYQLSITEYSNKGHVSGTWNVTFNESKGRITGTMRNSKGKTYKVNCKTYWD